MGKILLKHNKIEQVSDPSKMKGIHKQFLGRTQTKLQTKTIK